VTIEITQLGPDLVEPYRRIRLAALAKAPDAFGSDHAVEAARSLDHFAERLRSAVMFGAWADGEIVGTMNYQRGARAKERHKAVVGGVFVEPAWRRHGIAARLLATLIEHARAEVEQLTLNVVGGNDKAIALYRRFGFEVYGVEPRARKTPDGYTDQILMVLLFTDEAHRVAAP
jgi:ribosomal protein S18 acetylase RimI-like enzyme